MKKHMLNYHNGHRERRGLQKGGKKKGMGGHLRILDIRESKYYLVMFEHRNGEV